MDRKELRREREVLRNLLREMRIEAGLRQQDVADRLQVPQSFVSKYESGERRLDVIELRRLCLALDIGLGEFAHRLDRRLESEAKR